MVSPDFEGLSSKDAMLEAIMCAKISPDDIGYINAHGTSTILGDKTESKAIREVWQKKCPFVSSIKSQIGHLLGASGAVEAVATIMMLKKGIIPSSVYELDLDKDCLLNIPQKEQKISIDYAISNSFGFGGHNACLVFKKWGGQ